MQKILFCVYDTYTGTFQGVNMTDSVAWLPIYV